MYWLISPQTNIMNTSTPLMQDTISGTGKDQALKAASWSLKALFTSMLLFFAGIFLSVQSIAQTTVTIAAGTTTWTCPVGVYTVTVECGGGGGADWTRTRAGGGGCDCGAVTGPLRRTRGTSFASRASSRPPARWAAASNRGSGIGVRTTSSTAIEALSNSPFKAAAPGRGSPAGSAWMMRRTMDAQP